MKFSTKLYGGLGIIFILIMILIAVLMSMLKQQNVKMHVIVNELSERIRVTAIIKNEINNMSREAMEISINPSEKALLDTLNDWEESRTNIASSLGALKEMDKRKQTQELIMKFSTIFQTYEEDGQELIYKYKRNMGQESDVIKALPSNQDKERLLQIVNILSTLQEQEMKDELFRTQGTYNIAVKIIYIYVFIGIFLSVAIAIWIIKGMTRNLYRVASVMSSVAYNQGTEFPRVSIKTKDEIGRIAEAYNEMAIALEQHSQQEKELKIKAEEQSWHDSKLAEITSAFPCAEDFNSLANLFINQVTPTIEAQYGVFYIKEGTGELQRLEKVASYGFAENASTNKQSFLLGEKLIGQCALENRPINLTHIPDDYIKLESGLGSAAPRNIYILPIEFEGEVLGVIEVASLKVFSLIQQKLLKMIIGHLGITINSIRNRMQVKKLLEESQALTEELQSQSEELQAQQEELIAINEELEVQYKTSEQKNEELEKLSVILEEKAHQLVLSSQYKTEFLANMSHELRTPLNSMLILAQMLLEKANDNLTLKQLEYLQTINSSGNDLLHLINEILDLAKIETGKIDIIEGEVRLESIKEFAEKQFCHLAEKKGLEFKVALHKDLSPFIYTDEHRLKQIISNLLANAFKFTTKGSVTLYIEEVGYSIPDNSKVLEAADSAITFTVKDTGIGIPKEKQNFIFGAFHQADGTTSRKYGGTGLGLSICKEISNLLGGAIRVESEEGRGSSFILYLPYKSKSQSKPIFSSQKEIAVSGENTESFMMEAKDFLFNKEIENESVLLVKGKKILIVDDDMRNIFSLSAVLEDYEMEVLFAENGREGLEVLMANQDIDLILMDIMMPEMDGFETMTKIRSMPEFQNLPIIALTAKAMKHNREQCIEAGASDYISKPINIKQLYSLIQVWLYRS
ncbi:ATP-binding protein [Niallia sp. NCCP-28]|uniref:hybrid sensor histidine kinase/response regulator n=1 Tax=Niallia sp. NCCP-28 TaxID=2934712 RepID=UPI0020853B69|nr:ATP-binding protein [Niallia sp. NCCP-28]GKU84598.1 histidine kinase [Niallia sp. NCCP-28]